MADNYLERQRELYEARKAAWEKTRRSKKRRYKTQKLLPRPLLLHLLSHQMRQIRKI